MNLVILLLVVVAVGTAAILLARTLGADRRINDKADSIAKTGQGINIATDSVVQLNRTNETAASILRTATPLESQLDKIVGAAGKIDNLAVSINDTAGKINTTAKDINTTAGTIGTTATGIGGSASAINTTAGQINNTAKAINVTASGILGVAGRINFDVATINRRLNGTIGLANTIERDTSVIVGQALAAHDTAACIDQKLPGGGGDDAHCGGRRASLDGAEGVNLALPTGRIGLPGTAGLQDTLKDVTDQVKDAVEDAGKTVNKTVGEANEAIKAKQQRAAAMAKCMERQARKAAQIGNVPVVPGQPAPKPPTRKQMRRACKEQLRLAGLGVGGIR